MEEEDPPVPVLPETTAYWSREPYAWSTSLQDYTPPMLTSSHCAKAVYKLFRNTYYSDVGDLDPYQPNFLLSVVTESSSHPAGLNALYAQPWMYAGPGLGNMDECPLQTCIAGGRKTDSITFASVCMMPECSAYDLAAEDFVSTVERQRDFAMSDSDFSTPQETMDLGHEYVLLLQRIADVNKFLKTGWTCGAFVVPFDPFPFGIPYVATCIGLVVCAAIGTCQRQQQRRANTTHSSETPRKNVVKTATSCSAAADENSTVASTSDEMSGLLLSQTKHPHQAYDSAINGMNGIQCADSGLRNSPFVADSSSSRRFWDAFDVSSHLKRLVSPSNHETACLDGLRSGSLFWIMLGHVMAIQSSSGAGYANPANFLPPTGLTTTLAGQLLFSSRLAVDTFLTISGFLVVYVLDDKLRQRSAGTKKSVEARPSFRNDVVIQYFKSIPFLLISRIVRTLPLYAMSLGFYTQVAPHLGSGPFWYQWMGLLKPCHDFAWSNFLFVNNFLPYDTPTTDTCFYHSWYLAVDMQLFVVAPVLVFWFQFNAKQGMCATFSLFLLSVLVTVYLSHARRWSVNTFDGVEVARYDMEAYAKPHVRAQSYLLGMYVAMRLLSNPARENCRSKQASICKEFTKSSWRSPYTTMHRLIMVLTLLVMTAVTFGTVTGAYARRPCTYDEDPLQDYCGSMWSPWTTFLYTALSRTGWSICIATIVHMSVGRSNWSSDGNLVSSLLSWSCWTPLSHLSFGAYLLHPIVIFIWQLGGREKQVFRLLTFGMDFLSVSVVSYAAALLAALMVEFPCAKLWKLTTERHQQPQFPISTEKMTSEESLVSLSPLTPPTEISRRLGYW